MRTGKKRATKELILKNFPNFKKDWRQELKNFPCYPPFHWYSRRKSPENFKFTASVLKEVLGRELTKRDLKLLNLMGKPYKEWYPAMIMDNIPKKRYEATKELILKGFSNFKKQWKEEVKDQNPKFPYPSAWHSSHVVKKNPKAYKIPPTILRQLLGRELTNLDKRVLKVVTIYDGMDIITFKVFKKMEELKRKGLDKKYVVGFDHKTGKVTVDKWGRS